MSSMILTEMFVSLVGVSVSHADLLGISANVGIPDTNDLYAVSTEDASLRFLGQIETPPFFGPMGSFELAPNGMYFGTTIHSVMKVDIDSGTAEEFLSAAQEGILTGLDFSSNGLGYLTNSPPGGFETEYTVFDSNTTEVLALGSIQDLNFLEVAFRSDGILLGIDSSTNDVWQIDPFSGDVDFAFSLAPEIGFVLALTTFGDQSFLVATDEAQPGLAGILYDFDLNTGETTLIGPIDADVTLIGLALVPSPAGAALIGLGALTCLQRRR